MLSVDEALSRILAGVQPLELETVSLQEGLGRVLAQPLKALRTQPPFHSSAMDGYAVRAEDVRPHGYLDVIGSSRAGAGFSGSLKAGEAVRIFTGAPVPEGADAVLIQEDTTQTGNGIVANTAVQIGQNIRMAGIDFRSGDEHILAGRPLSPRDLGLAAGLGHTLLQVHRRPRVALLSTGDELVSPGSVPGPDQIIATNSIAVAGLVQANGGECVDLGIVPDNRTPLLQAIAQVSELNSDILVTFGGVSVGDHDLVHEVLGDAGCRYGFWKIAMKPGKPMLYGTLEQTRVLGLPGNPVSAHVCALLYLRPLLRALQNRADVPPSFHTVGLGSALPANGPREHYIRALLRTGLDGETSAYPFENQDSSLMSTMAQADALIRRLPYAPEAMVGEKCLIMPLDQSS